MPSKNTGTIAVRMANKDIERLSKLANRNDTTISMVVKDVLKYKFSGALDEYILFEETCKRIGRDPIKTLRIITESLEPKRDPGSGN